MLYWTTAVLMLVAVALGLGVALLTLPGVWLMLLVAVVIQWWQPGVFSWWTLGMCAAVALVGEVLEVVLSAAVTRRVGGSRSAAWWSVLGALLGAMVGTFAVPVPVVGTLGGAVVGAGMGAYFAERRLMTTGPDGQTPISRAHAGRIALGAASGRLGATLVKVAIAALVGLALVAATLWP